MRLRHKKMHNLSQDALYTDFQNRHFQTHNRKPDFQKTPTKDSYKPSINTDIGKLSDAEILAKFIASVNLAKRRQKRNDKSKSQPQNILHRQIRKPKKGPKVSQSHSFEEEKKVEDVKAPKGLSTGITTKIKVEQNCSRVSGTFSNPKKPMGPQNPNNKSKEVSEQNIINNCFMGASFDMKDCARFVPSPYLMVNQQIIPSWFQMNPFMISSLAQLTALRENMEHGLSRQLEIYERFKPQTNLSQVEKSHFQTPPLLQKSQQKIQKHSPAVAQSKTMSPNKIFKRASYHVGIAYSIYMDGIQREGKKIKNYEEIDPTRHAKKYKAESQKSH